MNTQPDLIIGARLICSQSSCTLLLNEMDEQNCKM